MKTSVCFLSLAGLIASSLLISEAAKDGDSEMERIVGGEDAKVGQFPYAAALYRDGRFYCTASIIGETTVLTAAHCVVKVECYPMFHGNYYSSGWVLFRSDYYPVYYRNISNGVTTPAGSFYAIANLRRSAQTVRIDFASITPHPEYDESGFKNDIAVFKTTGPIAFSDTVKPICIPRNDTAPRKYKDLIAMGWGDTTRFRIINNIPEVLQYVEQEEASTLSCRLFYGSVEDYKICAGDAFNGICSGDSGGPLIINDTVPVQVGVASYGSAIAGCGFLAPSVWTRTSSFNGFIKEVAAGDTKLCEK